MVIKGSDLENQVDELVDVYNEITQMLGTDSASKKDQISTQAELDTETSEEVCSKKNCLQKLISSLLFKEWGK